MPNATLKINICKISDIHIIANNYAFGKLTWKDGGHEFQKRFFTASMDCVTIIETNKHANVEFCVTGFLVKKVGSGQNIGKIFENVCLTEINLIK